jgi:peroxiredoxin
LGYNVAEITYDPVDVLKSFAEQEQIGFVLLSDRKSAIIEAFGLLDDSVPATSNWHGFAHPVIFVIGPDGVIRHRFSESNYQQRPKVDVILYRLRREVNG